LHHLQNTFTFYNPLKFVIGLAIAVAVIFVVIAFFSGIVSILLAISSVVVIAVAFIVLMLMSRLI
jgi:hypothetical protein